MNGGAECSVAKVVEQFVAWGAECIMAWVVAHFGSGGTEYFVGLSLVAFSVCCHPNLLHVLPHFYIWGNMVSKNISL